MTEKKYENEGNHLRGRKKFDDLRKKAREGGVFQIIGEDTDFYLEIKLKVELDDPMFYYFLCEEDVAEDEDE